MSEGITVPSEDGTATFIPCDPNTVSDGYHTINEIYEHRNLLFIALMKSNPSKVWRSRLHDDGSSYPGWFVAGMSLPLGWSSLTPISYHLPDRLWDLLDNVPVLDVAPPFDGHTSEDVLKRLEQWVAGTRILFVPGIESEHLPLSDQVLRDPSFEDLKKTPIGVWFRVMNANGVFAYMHIRGKHCLIALEPRPPYCNRGSWIAKLEVLNEVELTIDWADGWNRYYFSRDVAMMELEAWLRVRKQLEEMSS